MTTSTDARYRVLRDAVIHDIIELAEKVGKRDLSGFVFQEIAQHFVTLIDDEEDEDGNDRDV